MNLNEIGDLDLGWLAGFIDGEGCFTLRVLNRLDRHDPTHPHWRIWVRLDISQLAIHRDALEKANKMLGGGGTISIHHPGTGRRRKCCKLVFMNNRNKFLQMIETLDKCPFVVKAKQYAIWKKAILAWQDMKKGRNTKNVNRPVYLKMIKFAKEMEEAKRPDMQIHLLPAQN